MQILIPVLEWAIVPSTVMVNVWEISFGRHVSSNSIHMGLSHTTLVKVTPPSLSFSLSCFPPPSFFMPLVVSSQPVVAGPKFDPRPVHVAFLIDKVALRQGFLWVLRFFWSQCHSTNTPYSFIFHGPYIIVVISSVIQTTRRLYKGLWP